MKFYHNYFEVITKLYPYIDYNLIDINRLLNMSNKEYKQFVKKLIKNIDKQKIDIKIGVSSNFYKRYIITLRGNKKVISMVSLTKRITNYGIQIEEVEDQDLNIDDINVCFCSSKELITHLINNFENININRTILIELIIQKYYNYEK